VQAFGLGQGCIGRMTGLRLWMKGYVGLVRDKGSDWCLSVAECMNCM
jgi:hypothetical protein